MSRLMMKAEGHNQHTDADGIGQHKFKLVGWWLTEPRAGRMQI